MSMFFRQAALTGGTLRLERALDEKERELQLQRVEIHGLREHLRAVEVAARRATPASGDGDTEGAWTHDDSETSISGKGSKNT